MESFITLLTCMMLAGTFFTGCVGEEYQYVDDADLQQGPGLISGADGVFLLYGTTPTEGAAEKTVEK